MRDGERWEEMGRDLERWGEIWRDEARFRVGERFGDMLRDL